MKKLFIFALTMLVIASCDSKKKSHDDDKDRTEQMADDDDSEEEALTFKTITYKEMKGIAEVELSVAFPVKGNDNLLKSIREYLNETFTDSYKGLLDDGKEMVKHYGDQLLDEYYELGQEYADDEYVTEVYFHKTITKDYETDGYVSLHETADYYTGGVHGSVNDYGISFRKSDGRRFGVDMMRNTNGYDFHQVIKEGLKKYFCDNDHLSSISDEELKEYLVSFSGDIDDLPLPSAPPYLTKDGIRFVYQPYEISYFAAGTPEFTIPYEDAKPFLTSAAIEMIGK